MVDHRSISLPECGATEYSAPEPCLLTYSCVADFKLIWCYNEKLGAMINQAK